VVGWLVWLLSHLAPNKKLLNMIEKRDKVKQAVLYIYISAVLCSRRSSSKFGGVHCIIITTTMSQ
jgi:hypothetical protein